MGENSPRTHNLDHNASYNVLNEADQEALEYYLQGGSRKEKRGYSGVERRSQASQLERQIVIVTEMKYKSPGSSERDFALNAFENWEPKSLQEINTVIDGATTRVNRAANTHTGTPERAVEDRYKVYSGYLLDAAEDLHTAHLGLTPTGESQPDPDKIRNTQEVLDLIAHQLMNRSFRWDNHWPNHRSAVYKERLKYWRGFTVAASKFADNEYLIKLYNFALSKSEERFKYWLKEKNLVEHMPQVQKLIAQGAIVPISLNSLLHRKARELTPQPEDAAVVDREETDFNTMIPASAREAIEEERQRNEAQVAAANEDYDREYERLDAMGFLSSESIRRELATMGIGRAALSTELRDQEDEQELRDIAERAAKPKQTKPKKVFKRRWRGESGPSDKRKESDYR